MKKALKVGAVLLVILLAVLGLASLALRFFLPPEKAKKLIVQQLSSRLKREVRVGDVSVGVLTGLAVSDLKISESPDFSRGTFISSDRFSIRLALLPLFRRQVEVKQITLDHPIIQVVRYADGKTYNF